MRQVRWYLVFAFAVGCVGSIALAKDEPRHDVVQAATRDAIEALRRDVSNAPINGNLTVGQFIEQTGEHDAFEAALQGAQQVGGSRWIGDDTCMVRVELGGDTVASTLVGIAKKHEKDSPIAPARLQKRLAEWKSRTFSAEGSSTTANSSKDLRPADDNAPWRDVSAAARREAVASARMAAAQRVLNSLQDVQIAGDRTVGDALDVPSVRSTLQSWLVNRPVQDVQFHSDLIVELKIAAPADEFWPVFRQALSEQSQVRQPQNEAEWSRLRDEVSHQIAPGVGRAAAIKTAAPAQGKGLVVLPDRAPRWAFDSLDATGRSKKAEGKLLTKKHAEDDALRSLRVQVEKLPLGEGHTIGEAAKNDAAINAAIDRSLLRAHVYKVDYRDDGGVDVGYQLDLRIVWKELTSR